jgi:hypothetical protein
MKKIKIFISVLLILIVVSRLNGQNTPQEKFDRMLNAYVLGMDQEMLNNCLDIISNNNYKAVREDALWFIAEYFISKGISTDSTDSDIESLSKALTFYNRYANDYPNGKYAQIVNKRIDLLISKYAVNIEFADYLKTMYAERVIVKSLFYNTKFIVDISGINPFAYFKNSEFNQSPQYIANKYFDEIIVNFPDFKIFAYQEKILMNLDSLFYIQLVSKGLMGEDIKHRQISESFDNEKYNRIKNRALKYLNILNKEYPSHPITLDLHLMFARVFMEKKHNKINYETLEHLTYVLENETDKLSLRYLFAKEFVSNNVFMNPDN